MPKTTCQTCFNDYHWAWEEAFDKFGFGDGDGQVMTEAVANVLRASGYAVIVEPWGIHNTTIVSIKKDELEQSPFGRITFGYDDPRSYLPEIVVRLLDERFPDQEEVSA
jgi:hypothetical protein